MMFGLIGFILIIIDVDGSICRCWFRDLCKRNS